MNRGEIRELSGKTIWVMTGCGKLYITINRSESGKIIETFFNLGRSGGCASGFLETLGRFVSLMFQESERNEEKIIKQMRGIKCPRFAFDNEYGKIESCIDAIYSVLSKELEFVPTSKLDGEALEYQCEQCGSENIVFEGKCYTCMDCDFTKC